MEWLHSLIEWFKILFQELKSISMKDTWNDIAYSFRQGWLESDWNTIIFPYFGNVRDDFIFEFCKVSFLCNQGDINWLGWIVLILLIGLLIYGLDEFIEFLKKIIYRIEKLMNSFLVGTFIIKMLKFIFNNFWNLISLFVVIIIILLVIMV